MLFGIGVSSSCGATVAACYFHGIGLLKLDAIRCDSSLGLVSWQARRYERLGLPSTFEASDKSSNRILVARTRVDAMGNLVSRSLLRLYLQ